MVMKEKRNGMLILTPHSHVPNRSQGNVKTFVQINSSLIQEFIKKKNLNYEK